MPLESQCFTLVVFVHPQCPCSDATVAELTRLMTVCHDKLIAHALFIRPGGFASGWEQTNLWRDAARILGVFVACDPDGVEAKRFGGVRSVDRTTSATPTSVAPTDLAAIARVG